MLDALLLKKSFNLGGNSKQYEQENFRERERGVGRNKSSDEDLPK
jgi:hypothetical protein